MSATPHKQRSQRACGLRLALLALGSLWLWCEQGAAQAREPDAKTREQARAHYEQGARHYEHGQYLDAVHAFEQAYALSGAKPLLFNIAQAYRLVGPGHCTEAREAYERYLAADPGTANRAEVEERIASMQACERARAEGQSAPARTNVAQPSDRQAVVSPREVRATRVDAPARKPSRVLPLSLIVGGSLVALGGVALYALARAEYAQAEASCPCPEGKYTRWERLTRASYGLAATGGGALASGLVWLGALRSSRYSLGISPWRVRFTGRF